MIIFEIRLPYLLQFSAEFELNNCADNTKIQVRILGFVHEIAAIKVFVRDFTNSDRYKLTINSMVYMIAARRWGILDLKLFLYLLRCFIRFRFMARILPKTGFVSFSLNRRVIERTISHKLLYKFCIHTIWLPFMNIFLIIRRQLIHFFIVMWLIEF